MNAAVRRAYRRELDRHGQDVDLVTYTKTGEDEYGEDYDETTKTVTARVTSRRQLTVDRSHQEAGTVNTDFDVYVKDSVTGITDGGGRGATEVDVDQDGEPEFVVLVLDDQGNGLYRLGSERL